ncbi:hypothetical protein KW801_03005 [Candidatus Saccharibacteria bacterium]|nr:hypothetical protein [Candidatus Saccharibacteria bacterium]
MSLASILILLAIVSLIWRNLSSPSVGQVAIANTPTGPTQKLPEYTTLSTNFYSLNYSQRYSQQATDIPPGGVLDQKVLSYKLGGQPGNSTIEVLIKSAPYGGITLDSTYDYYLKHQTQFKLSNKFYHGEAIDIARSTKSSPETTGMWLHDSFLMIVKITTPDKSQNIDGELKDILTSVQWRDS